MLKISESFMSIQGEGASVGVPAFFIRLQNCNLMCGGHNARLVKENKATWWCDSEIIWRQGIETTNEELEQNIINLGIFEKILDGTIHLVWTGGEPTLPKNQKSIIDFLDYINIKYPNNLIYNEIETNGTIVVLDKFYDANNFRINGQYIKTGYIDQINCSPKLANSGMPENMRVVPDAIKQINAIENSYFKFVISKEEDIKEIQETYINPFIIKSSKVILMPGVDNRETLAERTAFLFEMVKKYYYRGVTRQHILAWNKTCGV